MKKVALISGAALLLGSASVFFLLKDKTVTVEAHTVSRGVVEHTIANTRAGTLKACRRSKLSMPIGGRVAALYVKEGDRVEAGQKLLELWNADRKAALQEAHAMLTAARKKQEQACLEADHAQRELKRIRTLASKQIATEDQLDQARTAAESAALACDAAATEIAMAEARIEVQSAQLAETQLVAPFAGVVAEINGEIGEYVTPSPPGVATPPAVDLIDDSCLYVTAPIDEVDAASLKIGLPARISLDAFRDRQFSGQVIRIAPYVLDLAKQARTVDVDVQFKEPPQDISLLAGYSADTEIVLETRENVLRIPADTVDSNDAVWWIDPDDHTLSKRPITRGLANWEWVEVREGLAEGDRIVASLDNPELAEGVTVKLTEQP